MSIYEKTMAWVTATIAAITGVIVAGKKMALVARRVGHFLDDWFGEDAREGHPATPGVMERLEAIEHRLDSLEDAVNEGHSKTN